LYGKIFETTKEENRFLVSVKRNWGLFLAERKESVNFAEKN
jgi:hypothetical protein